MNPTSNYSYCKELDHTIEECPYLIAKFQERNMGNQNPPKNANPNIQNIYAEPWELNIAIITRGGAATGANQEAPYEKLRV